MLARDHTGKIGPLLNFEGCFRRGNPEIAGQYSLFVSGPCGGTRLCRPPVRGCFGARLGCCQENCDGGIFSMTAVPL